MAFGIVCSGSSSFLLIVSLMCALTDASRFRQKAVSSLAGQNMAMVSGREAATSTVVSKTVMQPRSASSSFLQKKSARTCDAPSIRHRVVKHLWKVHGSQDGGNHGGVIPGETIDALIKQLHVPSSFDWRAFDRDRDGGFSQQEFYVAADKALQLPSSAKLVTKVEQVCNRNSKPRKDSSADDSSSHQQKKSAQDHESSLAKDLRAPDGALNMQSHEVAFHQQMDRVFQKFAGGSNGRLDAHQLASIMKQYAVPSSFDWHAFDVDGDRKLSHQEFLNAALKVAAMSK